jgi:hypothetical protein
MLPRRPSKAPAIRLSLEAMATKAVNGKILLFWLAAVTAAGFFLAHVADTPAELTARFTIDDSFYYFETAWRTRLSGFVTFDSIHAANGVHFLWFLLTLGIAYLAPAKIYVLYGAYCLSLVLIAAVYVAIWRVGTLVDDRGRLLTLLMALLWTFLLADRANLFFVGMESTLHMAVLWGCLAAALALLRAAERGRRFPRREWLVFTGFAVLVTWTRLDSALYSLFLYGYVAACLMRSRSFSRAELRKHAAISLAIVTGGAAIQIGFFYGAGGTVLPISGLVKATGVGPAIAADTWTRYMSVVFPMTTFVPSHTPAHLAVEALLFLALLGYSIARARNAALPLRRLHGLAATLGLATLVYVPIVGAYHDPFWRWYLAPVFLFYMLSVAAALREARDSLPWRFLSAPALGTVAGTGTLLFLLALFGASYRPVPHYLARVQLGKYLEQTTAESDILAAFNAGQVAFFSERRTVNIDGLVNDETFLRTVLARPNALLPYLRAEKVSYVVDYDFYWADAEIRAGTTLRQAFPIRNDGLKRVLEVREVEEE